MRNNDNCNREQGARFFRICKHRIRLRMCSLPHSIQRHCYCVLIVSAYTLPPHAQAGEVACAISNELPPRGKRVLLLKKKKKKRDAAYTLVKQRRARRVSFHFIHFERLWQPGRFWNVKHYRRSDESVLSACNDYFFWRISYIRKDTKIYILTRIIYSFITIILVFISHIHVSVKSI
jgi:hypothetical protein